MKRRYLIPCGILLLSLPLLGAAAVADMVLPDGNRAWTVQIFTTGGFTGAGVGDFAISSQGTILCSLPQACPKRFAASTVRQLIESLPFTTPMIRPAVFSGCYDCITRRIVIRYRDVMGAEHSYSETWDDLSGSKLPPQVKQIYAAVVTAER